MKQRSGFTVMFRLIGLVRPLAGYMLTAVGLGVAGFVCSTFLTVLGAWSLWNLLAENGQSVGLFLGLIALFGVLRGFLRYGEQACNHYIAFKLWRSSATKFLQHCAAFAPPSWKAATRAI